ncbi:MAG: putative bifunctional diguanylate cyclase/phosphodiesterase [Gammaproteobacteria bacterium]
MSQSPDWNASPTLPPELFAAAIEESVDAIYLIEPESGLILFANRAGRESLGYEQQELMHMRVSDVQVKVVSDQQWAQVLDTMREHGRLLFRGEHLRRDGSSFPVEVHSTIACFEDHEFMISVVRDMSGWALQEDALRVSETKLRTVLNTMGEGVLVLDAQGDFIIVNEAFSRLTGIDRDQIEGRKPLDNWPVIHEDGSEYPGEELPSWYTLKTGKPVRNDVQGVIRPDGEICWLLAHSEPLITEESGEFQGVLVTLSDITELKDKEAELDVRARTDALTGHPNRFAFIESLSTALEQQDDNAQLAVLFLDMDNFKAINDGMGHQVGDELLRVVAERFKEEVPGGADIARLGGDEFIAQMPIEHDLDAAVRAEAMLDCLRAPFAIDDRRLFISGSIGVAVFPRDGANPVELMKNADIAMYRAKKEGRNRYRFFSRELGVGADRTLTISSDLRQAINERQFELHFQPIICLETGRVASVEALLRWNHPRLGQILPEQFIDILENTGMIVELGAWVLDSACAAIAQMRSEVDDSLSVSVNLSPREFRQQRFLDVVRETLARHELPGSALHFELTERVLVDDELIAIELIQRLRDLDVLVSLDDFGTGYSSLQYLNQLPVQRLKIDKSFIPESDLEAPRLSMVRTIIGLAHALSLDVVVEGVESELQLQLMRAEGANLAQGFLISKAISKEAILEMLKQGASPESFGLGA